MESTGLAGTPTGSLPAASTSPSEYLSFSGSTSNESNTRLQSWSITDNVAIPDLTVHTSSPVWRARYLPFGRGVLTLPQRSDHALSIWGRAKIERGDTAQPVARFEGAREGVKEFVWRTRGGDDLNNGESYIWIGRMLADAGFERR